MENSVQTEKQNREVKQLKDTHHDEYWSKKYDISIDELRKEENTAISNVIIEAGIKHKTFSLQD